MFRFVSKILIVGCIAWVNWTLIALAYAPRATPTPIPPATPAARIPFTTITGSVVDASGPVANAIVRVQATANQATTTADGRFSLRVVMGTQPLTVTAWAEGYYIGWVAAPAGSTALTITLNSHYHTDNNNYNWFEFEGVKGSAACGLCHTAYEEWRADAHAQSAQNPRFLSLYSGTDIDGNRSPAYAKTSLGIPLPPDLTKPYYGPGYKLDFPGRAGSCATCHTPVASTNPNTKNCGWSGCHASTTYERAADILDPGVEPLDLKGDAAEGITCEFCHKVGEVFLARDTDLPYPDLPGILSLRLYRPNEGADLFFGPLDDIARSDVEQPRDVYLPLLKESAFCAGCHYGILGGVVVGNMDVKGGVLVYSSYAEWLDSPWSDLKTGKSCQECHMPPVAGADHFVFPARGGVLRPSDQIHTHKMLGPQDENFLQSAVTLSATATMSDSQLLVGVGVTNIGAGHYLPTDSVLRHVVLIVEAVDQNGKSLQLAHGPTLPDWAGDLAAVPGRVFAKTLEDEWTGEMPTSAIWRPVKIAQDTRLAPYATDASAYTFLLPASGVVQVKVRLLYRRAPQQLMEWKRWSDPDLLIAEQTVRVNTFLRLH